MTSILFFGLLIGMQHALEADHVAAVSSIASRERSLRQIVRHGAFWGVGHAVTLAVLSGAAIGLGLNIGDRMSVWLELVVGIMLVGLGIHVVYRLYKERVHFHLHRHGDSIEHMHAHSHAGDTAAHDAKRHAHKHRVGVPFRTLVVGMMHGTAGSAALIVLAASTVRNAFEGMVYVFLFGVGSVLGMMLLSAIIAVPLSMSARYLTWANRGLQGGIGVFTIILGLVVMYRSALAAGIAG